MNNETFPVLIALINWVCYTMNKQGGKFKSNESFVYNLANTKLIDLTTLSQYFQSH